MTTEARSRTLKIVVVLCWAAILIAAYFWLKESGIPWRHLPRFLHGRLGGLGLWGPLILLGLYLLRGLLFFFVPTTVLTIVSGSLYGPMLGTILNIIGENASAALSFGLGRLFGRKFVKVHEHGWVKKYDAVLREEGFFAVLFMRLLFFPFELVNYGSGMTAMLFRQFAFATFLGTLPGILTFSILGDTFRSPRAILIFLVLILFTLVGVFFLRRSSWVKRRIFPDHPPKEHVL